MHGDVGMPSQGGLPFLSNPSTTTGAGPTTLQQGPPLLPPGTVQGGLRPTPGPARCSAAWPVLRQTPE